MIQTQYTLDISLIGEGVLPKSHTATQEITSVDMALK